MEENPLDKLKTEMIEHPTTLDVVSSLLNDDNIEMKTEIVNPYALDVLMIYADVFENAEMKEIAELIRGYKNLLLKYMVSNKRRSREELVEILKGYFSLEHEKESKLTLSSNLAKINQNTQF